jgi:hypothetical protein
MFLTDSKKSIIFTIMALMIFFVIFLYSNYSLQSTNYSQNDEFEKIRTQNINDEYKYFKEVLLKDYVLISTYFSLYNLSTNSEFYKEAKSMLKFNQIVKDLSVIGNYKTLTNKHNLTFYLKQYKKNFDETHNLNFTYNLLSYRIYEKTPYFLTIEVDMKLSIKTNDNLTSWNSIERQTYDLNIFDLYEPVFYQNLRKNIPIKSELVLSDFNWSLKTFKNSILEKTNPYVYLEPNYLTTIGNSYLGGIINQSYKIFEKVNFDFNFDYDIEKNKRFDNSLKNTSSKFYGSTIIYENFEDKDLTDYDVSISKILTTQNCYYKNCSKQISLTFSNIKKELENDFTISFWINLTKDTNKKILESDLFNLETNNLNNLNFSFENNLIYQKEIKNNSWQFITLKYEKLNQTYFNIKIFSNTNLIFNNIFLNTKKTQNLTYLEFSNSVFDEIGVYKRALSDFEILEIFNNRDKHLINYKKDEFKNSIKLFKNENFEIIKNLDFSNDFTFSFWFKPTGLIDNNIVNFSNNFNLKLKNNVLISTISNNIFKQNINIDKNWYFYLLTFDKSSNLFQIYLNSKLVQSSNIIIGPISNISFNNFLGQIDEIKFKNLFSTKEKIENLFYNYNSFGKGCCNYVYLVNPNKFSFNKISYKNKNISYSSNLFFKYLKDGILPNVALIKFKNLTSTTTTKNYYNFKLDFCMAELFNIASFDTYEIINPVLNTKTCKGLIENGIY